VTRPRPVTGDLAALVQGFVSRIPGEASGSFRRPGPGESDAMQAAFGAVVEGDLDAADRAADPRGYSVVEYTDTADGRRLAILAERQRPDGTWPNCWGLFVHQMGSASLLTVEVPHPVFDAHTELVGLELFRSARAANLFMAGAGRRANADGSADVAHNGASVFEAVHRRALTPGSMVIQPHGFDEGENRGLGDAVVSSGAVPADDLAGAVARALEALGLRVCLFDGVRCRTMGGTRNVQGASTRAAGGSFVHLELAAGIRASQALSREVSRAVAGAIRSLAKPSIVRPR
jgi:hypothetical protein